MAKAPLAGQVKTRLMPALSAEQAAAVARALLIDQLAHLSALADAALYLAFTPATERELFQALAPPGFCLLPQEDGDLGTRMRAVFTELWRRGHENIALIGGDVPTVPPSFFEQAFAWLESSPAGVVLGPSDDGGYYLVAMGQPHFGVFTGITWSRSDVLQRTAAKLANLHIKFKLLPALFDIDTVDDLGRLCSRLAEDASGMKNTAALLQELRLAGKLNPRATDRNPT
jgi:rSAM/selenodomain-associated transferase 1